MTQPNPTFDLLLKGGHVIDPANRIDGIADVAIHQGRILRTAPDINPAEAHNTVDVSGLLVTPGILDIHLHAYVTRWEHHPGAWRGSLDPDHHFLASGVTTCLDTGTAGADEIEHFKTTVIRTAITRVLALVNISKPGMGEAEQTISNFDVEAAAEAALAHRDVVVGIKTAHFWTSKPFDAEHPPWESVEKAVAAGRLCEMPVMVDFWPRPERPYPELILGKLRPGDIHTHVFAQQFPVLDGEGRVQPYMREARARGVWFDVGHGAASFWFRNGKRALDDGFPPDSISTDLHAGSIRTTVRSMLDAMSKYLAMGMPLQEVIYRSTVTPAQAIRRPELGTLSPGAEADVAVLEVQRGNFSFRDCGFARIDGDRKLDCVMTLRAGRIVFERDGHALPHWRDAAESYWRLPDLQTGGTRRLWRPLR
jgi:dihydroorotase